MASTSVGLLEHRDVAPPENMLVPALLVRMHAPTSSSKRTSYDDRIEVLHELVCVGVRGGWLN